MNGELRALQLVESQVTKKSSSLVAEGQNISLVLIVLAINSICRRKPESCVAERLIVVLSLGRSGPVTKWIGPRPGQDTGPGPNDPRLHKPRTSKVVWDGYFFFQSTRYRGWSSSTLAMSARHMS